MNVRVEAADSFKRFAKPLLKKYPSLKGELKELERRLVANPTMGVSLGHSAYKIRLAIRSKGKGKSGGARVITYLQFTTMVTIQQQDEKTTIVNLIAIYDKSDVDSISYKELKPLIELIEGAT
jgi:mRNA-degrading endonuclease RelE of RelBE toxin-antitoxin system